MFTLKNPASRHGGSERAGQRGGRDRTSSELARRAVANDAFTRASASATAVSFAARSTMYWKPRSHSAQLEFSKPAPVQSSQPMKRSGAVLCARL